MFRNAVEKPSFPPPRPGPPRHSFSRVPRFVLRASHLALPALLLCLGIAGCQQMPFPGFVPDPNVDYSKGMLHRIVEGDCLSMISRYYGRDPGLLAWLNQLRPPYTLRQGEYLYIPPENNDNIVQSGTLTLYDIQATRLARNQRARVESKPREYLKTRLASDPPSEETEPQDSEAQETETAEVETKRVFDLKLKIPFMSKKPASKTRVADAPPRLANLAFIWPVEGRYSRGFSQSRARPHKGVDISAPRGRFVVAAEAGKVLLSGRWAGYGNVVVIYHGEGFSSLYGHNSKNLVRTGQIVRQGDPIALVGSTGRSTGNHTHFEIRYNGVAIDPERYLPPREGRTIASRRGSY